MIEIKNVTKKYGDKTAINNINFDIKDGEIFGFIGHNGAGKTTMIKSLVGILDFEDGDIFINNNSINSYDVIICPLTSHSVKALTNDCALVYNSEKAILLISLLLKSPVAVISSV